MAQHPPHAAFVDAAFTLSHAAPEQWQEFIAAFDAYAKHSCVTAVMSPNDSATVARGHAQGLILLAGMFNEIEARYRALHEKKR